MSDFRTRNTWLGGLALAGSTIAACLACHPSTESSSSTAPAIASSGAPAGASSETSSAVNEGATKESASPKTSAKEKRAIDPKTVGTIHGVIALDGTPPERKEMAIGNTAGCEKHPVPPLTEDVIAKDGKLANVFVYLKSGYESWIVPPPREDKVVLSQIGCMYRPRVIGLRVGQKLAVHNADPATHNVHARPERNEAFNQTQSPSSADIEWVPTKPELTIPFSCDVHPWMKAWVFVREHPWFAVSGEDGSFTIADVPPGEYTIEACHEKYGKKTGKLTLDPAGHAEISLAFAAK
jgi:hypothetical protein